MTRDIWITLYLIKRSKKKRTVKINQKISDHKNTLP